jgi:type I restriction enzyme S subunit
MADRLPTGWRTARFADLIVGGTRNGVYKPKEFHGRGAKIVNMGELFAHSRLRSIEMKRVELNDKELTSSTLEVGDLLFARRSLVAEGAGKCSIVCEVSEPTTFESSIIRARVDRAQADPVYLYYLFNSPLGRYLLGTILRHVAVAGITGADLVGLEVPLPSVEEQVRVCRTLGALDDKIELNRRMNETLEEMAWALFKSWFLDFDPVRARAEGRAPVGVDAATAALFPRSIGRHAGSELPTSWTYRTVGDLCGALFDGPHATPPEALDGPVFLGIRNLPGTSLDLTDVRHISETDWPEWTRRVAPQAGDIVFTYEATLGHFALLPPGLRCCLGRRTALLRPTGPSAARHFLFHWFIGAPFQEFLRSRVHPGATVDRILLSDFPAYPVLWPGEALAQRFEAVAAPIWSKVHANASEARALAELRDALLPKLLSGELRVRDADRIVERAV